MDARGTVPGARVSDTQGIVLVLLHLMHREPSPVHDRVEQWIRGMGACVKNASFYPTSDLRHLTSIFHRGFVMSKPKKRYYRKRVDFFRLLSKIKLWPSRTGVLHGIKTIERKGAYAEITTHCGHKFVVSTSKNSRAARWLRNKWAFHACRACRVPDWKLEKYSKTFFAQHYGSRLEEEKQLVR